MSEAVIPLQTPPMLEETRACEAEGCPLHSPIPWVVCPVSGYPPDRASKSTAMVSPAHAATRRGAREARCAFADSRALGVECFPIPLFLRLRQRFNSA
jgi:hypothetical protein